MTELPTPPSDDELARLERMSKALVEGIVAGGVVGVDLYAHSLAGETPRLVAEVRRLRAMIILAAPAVVSSEAWCNGCNRRLISQGHGPGCPLGAIQVEAERASTQSG